VDDRRFAVLQALALRHVAEAPVVARVAGMDEPTAASALGEAVADGDVTPMGEAYALSAPGRARLDETYAERFAAARGSSELAARMDEFEVVNRELLGVLTDWQTVTVGGQSVPNDHTDADYDDRIVGRLGELHDRVESALMQMTGHMPSMSRFVERLEHALGKADIGHREYVSSAAVDSYHTVWHEMHESMLRALGRARDD
jgi:hypothetical protein